MKKYEVSEKCIGCMACIGVAETNFKMNEEHKAFVNLQPETEEQLAECQKAMQICPVKAIHEKQTDMDIQPILATSNIKQTLEQYPELKSVLLALSPKFKRIQNSAVFNALSRFANFKDAARMTGLSVCEILHTINKHLGTEEALVQKMPECISGVYDLTNLFEDSVEITWQESSEQYIYNHDTVEEIIQKISALNAQQNIIILSMEKPFELIKVIKGLEMLYNLEKQERYRISVFNPRPKENIIPWKERKETFSILDVRKMKSDPFDIIVKKAYETAEGDGFVLIQRFRPDPLINMLESMGFESLSEQKQFGEVHIYFYKKIVPKSSADSDSKKVNVVIQSATPVAYPVMMRLLQSQKIRNALNIKELKVWEETEKHLGWIVSGRADISFSALITSARLKESDVKIPAIFVWDNFVILSRQPVKELADLKGREIHLPLFEQAPPAKLTKYLISASGLDVKDFKFVFGQPFGRPEQIYADFVSGKADAVLLREPEASYALKIMQDRQENVSVISYNEIWNKLNPGFGSFPNAGLVLKGQFVREHPDLTRVLLDELKDSIQWVNKHRKDAANLSFDMMRQPVDRIELFLDRVHFEYQEGDELVDKIKRYFQILSDQGVVSDEFPEEFFDMFYLDR